MSDIFCHSFVVTQDVIDENEHVNNVAYVQWMQEVAILHSNAVGCTRELYHRVGGGWVIRSHSIEYKAAAFEGDEIELYSWVSNMKKISSLRKYKFVHKESQKVLAVAETNWVYYNLKTNRPCAIHDEVKGAFNVVGAGDEP